MPLHPALGITVIPAWIAGIQSHGGLFQARPCVLDSAIPWRNDEMCVMNRIGRTWADCLALQRSTGAKADTVRPTAIRPSTS